MKHILCAAAISAASLSAFAADVGVSVTVGEPGFYGRIDIGSAPPPRVIYREPVIIERAPARVVRQPVYLHVPPGHAKNWRKHCHKYDTCGQPVYFVQDNWYNDVYVPDYQAKHGKHGDDHRRGHDKDNGKHKGKGRGDDR